LTPADPHQQAQAWRTAPDGVDTPPAGDAAWTAAGVPPPLATDEVHVWRVALAQPPAGFARLADRLSPDERRRAARFRFERDRRRYQVAHGALRELLGAYLDDRPERLGFVEGTHGKPVLAPPHGAELRFNLSHSGELALCAVSCRREVGVDLEQVRELADADALARRFFADAESKALAALPADERLAAFFRCWTRKEAYLKAVGAGLLQALDGFQVSLQPEAGPCALNVSGRPEETARWSLRGLDVAQGYVAAVVAERPSWRPVCRAFAGDPGPARAGRRAGS
jgi:4'-phosphopantetheinyl transferase